MGSNPLVEIGKKTPFVQNLWPNEKTDEKEKAWKDAGDSFFAAQGTSDQRHQDTLAQSMAYFQPVQQLLMNMYGKDALSPVNQFFAPPGSRPYHGTPGTPYDGPPLPDPGGTTYPAGGTWGATPTQPNQSLYEAALNTPKKAP